TVQDLQPLFRLRPKRLEPTDAPALVQRLRIAIGEAPDHTSNLAFVTGYVNRNEGGCSGSVHAFTPAPGAGSAVGSSGQRARAGAARSSTRPSARRSWPAQATMTPLSVHKAGGGTIRRSPSSSASAARRARRYALAATPPATTRASASGYSARNSSAARRVRSRRTSAAAAGKLAQRSCKSGGSNASGRRRSTVWRSAVLSPEKEKLQPGWPSIGRGSAKRPVSPVRDARSTAGPPGKPRPSIFAALS